MQAIDQAIAEPLYLWAESYVMQPGNGRRRAVSTNIQQLESVTTSALFWEKLQHYLSNTASLCSLHVFKSGVSPQYDDPRNATGGHFKTKPHTTEAADEALHRMAQAFIAGDLPYFGAINGITVAKKAKSSLLKLWISDSLNQTVIGALGAWFDENLADLCGRRLFSPHKYILNTFSQQKKEAGSYAAAPLLQPPEWSATRVNPPQPSPLRVAQPYAGAPSYPPFCPPRMPCAGPAYYPWAVPHVAPTYAQYNPWRCYSAQDSNSSSGSDYGCLSPSPSYGANSEGYTESLASLMECSRSDPAWASATAAAVAPRLEATMRKCEALRLSSSSVSSQELSRTPSTGSNLSDHDGSAEPTDFYG